MTRTLLHRFIRRQERTLDAPLHYLREIADSSPAAFFKFALLVPLGTHRRFLPLEAWHVARVAATFAEDCGTCAQIALNLARRDRISPSLLRAVISGNDNALPPPLADINRFVRLLLRRHDDPLLRERLVSHFGRNGFIELGLVIATSRFIPGLKRALGHVQSCALLRFETSLAA
jgi:hypothetical protein